MCSMTFVHWGKPLHTHLYLALDFVVTDLTHPPTQSLTLYLVGYPWLELILQLQDTMSLTKADLGRCVEECDPILE